MIKKSKVLKYTDDYIHHGECKYDCPSFMGAVYNCQLSNGACMEQALFSHYHHSLSEWDSFWNWAETLEVVCASDQVSMTLNRSVS